MVRLGLALLLGLVAVWLVAVAMLAVDRHWRGSPAGRGLVDRLAGS